MKKIEDFLQSLNRIPDVLENTEATAYELEQKNYEPFLLIPVAGLIRMSRKEVRDYLKELWSDDVAETAALLKITPEEFKIKQSEMVIYQYSLIARLRLNETEAWDQVYELYEDD